MKTCKWVAEIVIEDKVLAPEAPMEQFEIEEMIDEAFSDAPSGVAVSLKSIKQVES